MNKRVIQDDSSVLDNPFLKQMVIQLRAVVDSYGTYDTWSDAKVLGPFDFD